MSYANVVNLHCKCPHLVLFYLHSTFPYVVLDLRLYIFFLFYYLTTRYITAFMLCRWCKGKDCRRGYHPSCIETPLEETPSGTWYCEFCVQKKIQFGPHPLSQGIESLLNAQVVYLADCNGMGSFGQLVKSSVIAHYCPNVHNFFLPC